jgi:hypothetical protein
LDTGNASGSWFGVAGKWLIYWAKVFVDIDINSTNGEHLTHTLIKELVVVALVRAP